jgi:predicted transport protein
VAKELDLATVEDGLQSQLRNIETTYGRSIDDWIEVIWDSGRVRHADIVKWLKAEHALSHGAAHRLALVAIDSLSPKPPEQDPEEALYAGHADLLAIHRGLMTLVHSLGTDIEIAPKKGYLSIRRRKQFAMIKPATKHVDVGLILPGHPVSDRLEAAATFNALFTHRVRVRSVDAIDNELVQWIREAYHKAA